jgi:hypothetical protein
MKVIEDFEQRAIFGGDGNTVKHSIRVYECDGRKFTLDKIFDGIPPSFSLEEHPLNGQGLNRILKVNNQQYWGEGFGWAEVSQIAMESIARHCKNSVPHQPNPGVLNRAEDGSSISD